MAAVATALAVVLLASPARAQPHSEESDFAIDLVQQALSLIANEGGAERALEKMEDALEAPDPAGVDLDLVEEAAALVEDAGPGAQEEVLGEARQLLLEAAPTLAEATPVQRAVGMETGTTAVLDKFQPARGISGGGDAVLLVAALLAIALGLWLSGRWRPRHTIRQLRHIGEPGTKPAATTVEDQS